jgi:hypothetical protein
VNDAHQDQFYSIQEWVLLAIIGKLSFRAEVNVT